jgi:hypothetical protein
MTTTGAVASLSAGSGSLAMRLVTFTGTGIVRAVRTSPTLPR